jgi:hypothetical protein
MIYRVFVAATLVSAAVPSAAAKFTMQMKPSAQQTARMQDGIAAVDSSTAASSVRLIQPDAELKKRGVIQLLLMNQVDKPFNFGVENVSARLANGTPIAIIPYDQLAREEKGRRTWRRIAAGLASMNSGQYTARADYSGSSFGTIGTTPYSGFSSGSATVSGHDPVAAAVENRQIFNNLAAKNAAGLEALQENIRTTTVDPQQLFGGALTFELPKSVHQGKGDVPASFIVTIEGEQHKFDVLLKRR